MSSEMKLKVEVGPASGTGAWVMDLDFYSPKGIGSHQTTFSRGVRCSNYTLKNVVPATL